MARGRRRLALLAKTPFQLEHEPRRNELALAGIDETKKGDVREEHLPVPVHAPEEALPVEPSPAAKKHVRDVGAVEAIALHHVRLGPDELVSGDEVDLPPEDACLRRA